MKKLNKKGAGQLGIGAFIIIGLLFYFFATSTPQPASIVLGTFGEMNVKIHDGLANTTATEDTVDETDKFMTIYSADASIEEAEEYAFNISIGRSLIAEDVSVKVTCAIQDKDVSSSEDNLALKSGGKIILDFVGARNTGTAEGDNAVYTYVDMSEGTGSKNIQVKFDQDESYHDAMTDMTDYVDVICTIKSDSATDSVTARIYADA